MYSIKVNTLGILEFCVSLILLFSIYDTVSVGQLIMSPQVQLSTGVSNSTMGMLECLGDFYPSIDTIGLQKCVLESTVYNISKSRVPYVQTRGRAIPIAFVTHLFKKSVFVVDEYYSPQNEINQALILIHECSHLILSTKDHAYRWQTKFDNLTDEEHMENADSYVDLIVKRCFIDTDVFF
mgnify:CR=1 FL=1